MADTLDPTVRYWKSVVLIANGTVVTVPAGQSTTTTPVLIECPTGTDRAVFHFYMTKSATISTSTDTVELRGHLGTAKGAMPYRANATDTTNINFATSNNGGTTTDVSADVRTYPYMSLKFTNTSGGSITWTATEDVCICFPRA